MLLVSTVTSEPLCIVDAPSTKISRSDQCSAFWAVLWQFFFLTIKSKDRNYRHFPRISLYFPRIPCIYLEELI